MGVFIGFVANSIDYVIDKRERAERQKKMNMIIGVLFSELGIRLLKAFGGNNPAIGEIQAVPCCGGQMVGDDFKRAYNMLENHSYAVKSQDFNLGASPGLPEKTGGSHDPVCWKIPSCSNMRPSPN